VPLVFGIGMHFSPKDPLAVRTIAVDGTHVRQAAPERSFHRQNGQRAPRQGDRDGAAGFDHAGASGIGREMARAFAASGAKVFVFDIDAAGLDELAEELPGLTTGLCDVSRREQIERMVAEAAQALGGLDVLINNAGIAGPTAPVAELDPDAWEKVLQVNLTGTFNVTRLAIPHLIRAGGGVIINMSSAAGRFGYPNRSPYSTSKWGLIGFTKTLPIELGETASGLTPSCRARSTARGSRRCSRAVRR
jgi:NAD(P)-dependent dehydrogenase (short-subunit alcohol dehydrogenase family)